MATPAHSFVLVDPLAHSTQGTPPVDTELVQRILEHRRRQPDQQLFIDHLLQLAEPEGFLQYPPTDDAEFSQLSSRLAALSASSTGLTARSCLYYLSLAFSPSAEAAAAVAKDLLLPPAFRLSIRAFHALDSGDYRAAVRLLADPRVTPDFVPRTLAILSTLPEPSERAELVLSYWRLARIDLAAYGKDEVKCVLKALCAPERARGVAEAWSLAREWREEGERAELAKTVLETCFGDNHTGHPLGSHLSALLVLPFTTSEDALATSFCSSPPSPLPITLTVDWRLSKLIAESRPVDALRFWSSVRKSGKKGLELSQDRDRLLKAVEANLTSVQKASLELDTSSAPSAGAGKQGEATSGSTATLSQPAWAPAPAPAVSTPQPAARTINAARLAQLPPPPAAAPTASEVPLSASPFIRNPAASASQNGQGAVLRALEVATPKKASATPVKPVAPAPVSPFAFPPSAPSISGSAQSESTLAPPASPKPTLTGFGSVRQTPARTPAQGPRRLMPLTPPSASEDEEMRDARQESPKRKENGKDEKDEFARRAALDPAIARTIAAAAEPSSPKPAPPSTAKRVSRRSAPARGGAGARGDKRRAVQGQPPNEDRVDEERTVRLPPGAFPGQSEDEHGEEDEQPAQQGKKRASRGKSSSQPAQQTLARRMTRSRASTVEPASPPPQNTTTRRSTRASSVQPERQEQKQPEMREVERTPVRRSSRLSGQPQQGTARKSTRGRSRIEEESGEE
ncbi:Proteophosphoglycan ppg4 [Rhodotorula toruloides]|uniref:ELYS-like domain-containing protein n=1 Tax=Rhodotorula toruloides TaxID=5286 RepID=A0A0K3C8G7_RHOTO|nr:Proteophosphoglycan ppg4 [Rhodotorula toruloides]